MKTNWFIRRGLFFLPNSPIGWLLAVGGVAYAIWAFFDIDSRSHSGSDTLINWLFVWLLLASTYSLIAYFTSPRE